MAVPNGHKGKKVEGHPVRKGSAASLQQQARQTRRGVVPQLSLGNKSAKMHWEFRDVLVKAPDKVVPHHGKTQARAAPLPPNAHPI